MAMKDARTGRETIDVHGDVRVGRHERGVNGHTVEHFPAGGVDVNVETRDGDAVQLVDEPLRARPQKPISS